MELTSKFNGADCYRLATVLNAVADAGLTCGEYTQAGINQGNGNVFLWDEDWLGCCYVTLGGSVMWNWSCPYCGEEFDFDSYQELESFIENDLTEEGCCLACAE